MHPDLHKSPLKAVPADPVKYSGSVAASLENL